MTLVLVSSMSASARVLSRRLLAAVRRRRQSPTAIDA